MKPHPPFWPRLSETLFPATDLNICQACLRACDVSRWQEHDESDKPQPIIVLLCKECSAKLIEPHPRLYRELDKNEPMPGSMNMCVRCAYREGTRCAHPDLTANGGTGLIVKVPEPITAHLNRGRGKSGFIRLWPGPPSSCAGFSVVRITSVSTEAK